MLIRKFDNIHDGNELRFISGNFDKYMVNYSYYDDLNVRDEISPKDKWYFSELYEIGKLRGGRHREIYDDLYLVYNMIPQKEDIDENNPVSQEVLDKIIELAKKYDSVGKKNDIELLYTIIYAGMLAEQLKENSVIGKSIKMLGLYQVLVEGMDSKLATNCSRGVSVNVLREKCKVRGIPYEYVASGKCR